MPAHPDDPIFGSQRTESFDELMFPTTPPVVAPPKPSPSKDGEVKDIPPEPP